MSTGLEALKKIVARMAGNPRYSQALTRPRRTTNAASALGFSQPLNKAEVTRAELRNLVESKGQNVGTIREKFPGMPQQLDSWMVGGPDEAILSPRRGSRDKLQQLIEWLEGL